MLPIDNHALSKQKVFGRTNENIRPVGHKWIFVKNARMNTKLV